MQSNSVALLFESSRAIPRWVTGIVLSVAVFAVIIGGIRRIGRVAEYLVPFMAVVYVVGGIVVLLFNAPQVPGAFALIVEGRLHRHRRRRRVRRCRSAVPRSRTPRRAPTTRSARARSPCSALPRHHRGVHRDGPGDHHPGARTGGENGAELSMAAFGKGLPMYGEWIVTFGLAVFAFSTVLAWSYYGERCAEYIFGVRIILPYRWFWVLILFVGAIGDLGVIWRSPT